MSLSLLFICIVSLLFSISNGFMTISKKELRELYTDHCLSIRNKIINATLTRIYTDIIQKSQQGVYETKFSILCDANQYTPYPACKKTSETHVEQLMTKYSISVGNIVKEIKEELYEIFPDIYLDSSHRGDCCINYKMTW